MGDDAGEAPPPPEPVPALSEEELEERRALYDAVFEGLGPDEAKAKSLAERKEFEEPRNGLTYGELDIATVHHILNQVKSQFGPLYAGKGVFLDLGSGVGKACVAAALLHPFEKVVGIETLQSLSDAATASLAKYQELPFPEGFVKVDVELTKGDFVADMETKLDPILDKVAVCLAVASGFAEEQLKALATVAKKLPDDSILVTFTHRLPENLLIDLNRNPAQRRALAVKKALAVRGTEPSEVEIVVAPPENDPHGWTEVFSEELQLHWGPATMYIFKKIPTESVLTPVEQAPMADAE